MNFKLAGIDYRKCLTAMARCFFRASAAKDEEAASDGLLFLEDGIVFLLNRHLEQDQAWLDLRGPQDDKWSWWIDFLSESSVFGAAGEFIRVTSIACWYAGGKDTGRQLVDFQLFMVKGEYLGYTLGFGARQFELFQHISPHHENWAFWFEDLPQRQPCRASGTAISVPYFERGDIMHLLNGELTQAIAADDLDAVELINQRMRRDRETRRKQL